MRTAVENGRTGRIPEKPFVPHLKEYSEMSGNYRRCGTRSAELIIRTVAFPIRRVNIIVERGEVRLYAAVCRRAGAGAVSPPVIGETRGVVMPYSADR